MGATIEPTGPIPSAERDAGVRADLLLNTVRELFALLDWDWRCTFANDRVIQVTGLPRPQILGRTVWDIWPAVLGTPLETAARRAMERREQGALEYHHTPRDRWFEIRLNPFGDGGLAVLVLEVTERKLAEQAVAQRERELEDFFQSAVVGLHWVGPDGIILRANPAEMSLLGYSEEEYIGHHISEFHDDQDAINDILRRLQAGERLQEYPARLRCKNGATRDVLIDSSVLWDNDRFVHTRCFTRDVTAQKRMELQLERQRRELVTLVEHSPDVVFRLDADLRYLYINGAVERITGLKPRDFFGKTALEAGLPAALWSGFESTCRLAVRTGKAQSFEFAFESPRGVRFFQTRLVPEPPLEGRSATLLGITTDLTELRQAEAALREGDRRKDEFLATLAHELRNPLAPIVSSLELLKRAGDNPELIEQARSAMDRQIRQLARLIDDLLDISRITRNRLDLRLEPVELASVVHHAVEACRPLIDAAGHDLQVDLSPAPIYLNADPLRLAQVFGNLLTNACKYTDPGGHIRLWARLVDSEVFVSIEDDGIGISPEMLPRVFELFMQDDLGTGRSQGGLGVGLTLVKRLVELHGGTVTGSSAGEGRGSNFTVRLPVSRTATAPPRKEAGPKEAPVTPRRILVVDDNQDAAATLGALLRVTGHEVYLAFDGIMAVAKAEAVRPQVILLDLGLPGMTGHEVCRAVRLQSWGKDVQIVALTGWGQEEDRRRSTEAGFDGHLVKPVEYSALIELIRSHPSAETHAED